MQTEFPTNSGTLYILFIDFQPIGRHHSYEVFLGSLGNSMGTFPTEEAAVQYCETIQQAWS